MFGQSKTKQLEAENEALRTEIEDLKKSVLFIDLGKLIMDRLQEDEARLLLKLLDAKFEATDMYHQPSIPPSVRRLRDKLARLLKTS